MMSRKISSIPKLAGYQPFIPSTRATKTIFNSTREFVFIGRQQPTIQRWIFGMIIGSAPFLLILLCWMFVSLCINNVVRFYQYRRNRYRQDARTNGIGNDPPKIYV